MGVLVPKFAWAVAGIATTADTSNATRVNTNFRDFIKAPYALVMGVVNLKQVSEPAREGVQSRAPISGLFRIAKLGFTNQRNCYREE
jgi:hypothetical protein